MPTFDVALSWIVLSPVAFIQNALAIVVVLHYRPLFHSCDVVLISLLVTMATNAFLLLPVPAVVELGEFLWSQELCTFYVWLSVTLRASCHLALLVANVYWMASMRMTSKGHLFTSSKYTKLFVVLCWLASVVLGIIPATGGVVMFHYYDAAEGECRFLPGNIGFGFALVFIIMPMMSFVMGLLSSVDSLLLFRQIRARVLSKLNAGRFQLPGSNSSCPERRSTVHAKRSDLDVSTDLCRLVVIFTSVSSALNGLPLMVSQFVQMIQDHDRVAMETTLLYLLLIESLVVPHLLWLLSDRYHHAAVYTWKVFLRRDQSYREEDAAACVLQSFRFQVNGTNHRGHANGNGPPKTNGNAHTIEDSEMSMIASPESHAGHPVSTGLRPDQLSSGAPDQSRGRVRTIMTTDLDDGMTVITQVTTASTPDQDVQVIRTLAIQDHAELNESKPRVPPRKSPRNFAGNGSKGQANGKAVAVETLQVPPTAEVTRSPSSSSRKEWRDKMRKKYLPAVLLEKSADETARRDVAQINNSEHMYVEILDPVTLKKSSVAHSPNTDSNYYISGDFHYSYLGDSGSSAILKRQMMTEGDGGIYESCDIVSVLDDELAARGVEFIRGVNGDIYATPMKISNIGYAHDNDSVSETGMNEQSAEDIKFQLHESTTPVLFAYQGHVDLLKGHTNVLGVEFEDGDDNDIDADTLGSIEDTTALKSFIRRDNYRKFLPYTNLVISSVDVEDDQPSDQTVVHPVKETSTELKAEDIDLNKVDPGIEDQQSDNSSVEKPIEVVTNAHIDDVIKLPVVEYGRLETVSGTEMLMLKMKKVRQAIAMDSTDESNYSGDSSNDWSMDANDPSVKTISHNSDNLESKSSNSDTYHDKHSELKPQATENKRSFDISNSKTSPTSVGDSYSLQDNILARVPAAVAVSTTFTDSPMSGTQQMKHAVYSSNPFLRESFELSSQSHEFRKNLYTNPFVNPHDIFIGSDVFAAPSSSSVVGASSVRHPQHRQNSVKTRHTSSEDELDSIFDEQTSERSSFSSRNPFSFSKSDEADPGQDKNNESDSDTSDRSVIIKPYGRRRPAWMEDPLMNSNNSDSFAEFPASESSDTDTLEGSNRFSTFRVTVTDEDDDASEGVEEYDFDSVNIGGVSGGSSSGNIGGGAYNAMSYMRAPVLPANTVQYHFDEDIERGFEDALSMDYVSAGPAYGGLGLCFESIKEEPEESLSESLTSLDGVETTDSINVFKTQAVVSRPPSRASVTSPSLSCPPLPSFHDTFDDDATNATQFFPNFERTSADGSDDVGHLSTPPKPLLDPWGFALPDKPKNQVLLTQPFKFSVDSPHTIDGIETADDIVTSLAFKPERNNPFENIDKSNKTSLDSSQSPVVQNSYISQNSNNDASYTDQASAYF